MSSKILPKKGQWIVKLEKVHKCKECHNFFTGLFSFKEHIKSHSVKTETNDQSWNIQLDLTSEENDQRYKHEEKDKKSIECMVCNKYFAKSEVLNSHMRKVHEEKKFKCTICHRKFSLSLDLKKHLSLSCKGNDTIVESKCNQCEKSFKNHRYLREHCKNVHKEKKFKCYKCDKLFVSDLQMEKHLSTSCKRNDEVAESKCDKCEKTFKIPSRLRHHFYNVHREKKFKCDKCDLSFAFQSYLEKHLEDCGKCLAVRTVAKKVIANLST